MSDAWEEVQDWERWAREVLTDWRVPFDNHKVGLRLGITLKLCDQKYDYDALAARLAEEEKQHDITAVAYGEAKARLAEMPIALALIKTWRERAEKAEARLAEAEFLLKRVTHRDGAEPLRGSALLDEIESFVGAADQPTAALMDRKKDDYCDCHAPLWRNDRRDNTCLRCNRSPRPTDNQSAVRVWCRDCGRTQDYERCANEDCRMAAYQPPPLQVTCARCGIAGTSETFYIEEGDEWECPQCWERCEAQERLNYRGWGAMGEP